MLGMGAGFVADVLRFFGTGLPTPAPLAGLFLRSEEALLVFDPRAVRVEVVLVRDAGFCTPVGLATFDANVFLPSPPFFASAASEGSFFATLLTSPRAARFRAAGAPLAGAVVVRLVVNAFLGGSPAEVSRAAALARVTRVVPTFSAFSSVTARRATLACEHVSTRRRR